jgi:hypothetical protein
LVREDYGNAIGEANGSAIHFCVADRAQTRLNLLVPAVINGVPVSTAARGEVRAREDWDRWIASLRSQ